MSATRNAGMSLDSSLLKSIRINTSAVEKRCAELPGRRTVKKEFQVAWLLKAITLIDLTTLGGDDTERRVNRLCGKALNPVNKDVLDTLDFRDSLRTAAVCVYHQMLPVAVRAVKTRIPVAVVSTGFPAGLTDLELNNRAVSESVNAGANEIDVVITRKHVFQQNWQSLYDELSGYRARCKHAHLKVILATGDLKTLSNVAKASWVAMMAGADFIKTSTGKESTNATPAVSLVMLRAIRDYQWLTGFDVGFKPAGGISNTRQALNMMALVNEELGGRWLKPNLFRFGASSLLHDIERQLFHAAYGCYSADCYHSLT